jgi:hypothetical protein
MRIFYSAIIAFFFHLSLKAQSVDVAGECISGIITLNSIGDVNGKPAYQGMGTVDGAAGVTVSIYWLEAPDNVWVIDFDGQPYFQNTCNFASPPATGSSCPWTSVIGTTCTGGTALSVTGSGVTLPVKLTSFSATQINYQALLIWKTATEINNNGFEVQRSIDGNGWMMIGFVNGVGNSASETTYQFIDSTHLAGKNYYRLLQHDIDGHGLYSSVVSVDFTNEIYYRLANNPGTGIYQLNIRSQRPVELFVSDMQGRRLSSNIVWSGIYQLNISKYPTGIYLLQIKDDNEIITRKLIKQ